MGDEVDTQNKHIDRIIGKTDKVDDQVCHIIGSIQWVWHTLLISIQIAMNRARLDRIH
jgi:hypothetical protein